MNTKAFKFAEEESYMMRPYQNFKELVLSSANSMGVKEGKISLKCLYWYLMYNLHSRVNYNEECKKH